MKTEIALLVLGFMLGAPAGGKLIDWRYEQIIAYERSAAQKAIRAGHLIASRPSPSACANAARLALDADAMQESMR